MTNKEERALRYYLNAVRILGRAYQIAREAYWTIADEHRERYQTIVNVFADPDSDVDLIRNECFYKTANLAVIALQIEFLKGRLETVKDRYQRDDLECLLNNCKRLHIDAARTNRRG